MTRHIYFISSFKIVFQKIYAISLLLGFAYLPLIAQNRYNYSKGAMGSEFNLICYAPNDSIAKIASDSVFSRINYLNSILSDYLDGSEVNRLSATAGTGERFYASTILFDILQKSQHYSRQTKGTFDVTVGPIVQLWRRAMRRNYFPDKAQINLAKSAVGYRNMVLNAKEKWVLLKKKNMRIDFGGIGKGYAADEALSVLAYFGISQALLDAGGDLAIGDAPPNKAGWEINISSGEIVSKETVRNNTDTILILKKCGIATSGATYRYLQHNGVRYSHIVNPRTGVGLTTHTRTTVIAQNGTAADALATAFSVAGIKHSKRIIKKIKQLKIWLIEQDGKQWRNF